MSTQNKSRKIRQLEKEQGTTLEHFLPLLVTTHGYKNTARILGIKEPNIYNWIKRYEMSTHFVCLGPNDTLTITRED